MIPRGGGAGSGGGRQRGSEPRAAARRLPAPARRGLPGTERPRPPRLGAAAAAAAAAGRGGGSL